jgi:hypothetical protein
MAENNSISTLLPEFLRLFNNSLEGFEKVNQAITSNRDSVTLDVQNESGTISRVTIPSFGFLKNSVDRLETNINTITNVGGGSSSIRLSDGTFRKLVLAKLPTEAPDLESINTVNEFNIKPNWFFEELINPLLYISFDLTGQVPINTERAIIQRYILDTNTQAKIQVFENNFNGRSDIEYFSFLQKIVERNISYVLDESVVDLPPRTKRFSGKFSVTRISDIDFTEEINGVTVVSKKKQYKLNKLFYTDSQADFDDTVQLKVGDSLEIVSIPIDTRYIIKSIDSSTNTVILELVEGSKPVQIGADILKIGSTLNDNVQVDVTVGFNERCVTFIKPIDPESKIPSTNWSPGSGFYTNNLTTIAEDGTQQNLADYYQRYAVDFGKFLLSFAEDKIPTSREGIVPNAPQLNPADFSVKLINGQVINSDSIVQLQDLSNQKNTLESAIKELDSAINQYRTKIQTSNYATDVERDADKNTLRGLVTERGSQSELYSSIVKEIEAKGNDNSIASIAPKYRARGFWPMPREKSNPATGPQAIIKFKIRYRYLSQDGTANPVDQFIFTDGDSDNQGTFSNYEILESVLRPRVKNNITGLYQWASINDEVADEVNINQLDIPIRKGEIVEVQVKSISEAGWPSNPIESEWSSPIRIEFPADLSSDNAVESILEQNKQDIANVALQESIEAKGINEHLSSSFIANERYYAHGAQSIASGFLSENQTPIDLFSKLNEMQARLDEFTEILRNAAGELVTTLIDDKGNVIKLNRNSTTKVFAGFYFNEVKALDDPRGAIISKTFFINIANSEQTGLRLISRIAGSRTRMTRQSESPNYTVGEISDGTVILPATYTWLNNSANNQSDGRPTYISSDSEYNVIRKYDLSPILLTNPSVLSSNKFGQTISLSPYQSAQNKNQFIYSRYKDVSSEETFYNYINPENDYTFNLDTCENFFEKDSFSPSITAGQFIWGGGFDVNGNPTTTGSYGSLGDQSIEVHITHPWVSSYEAYRAAYVYLTGDSTTLPVTLTGPIDCTLVGNGTAAVMFRQSKFISLFSDQLKGKQQSIYLNENVAELNLFSNTTINFNNSQVLQASPSLVAISALSDPNDPNFVNYARNVKTSFESFDQYLLGRNSCGSYLFISTDEHSSIQVDGDSIQSSKVIQFGSPNSINVPLVFQYRMTDYFGAGSGSTGGIGNIIGDISGATTNLTYSKKIGFDIWTNMDSVFQYDVEIFAKYKSDNLNTDVFPSATITKGLGDLEKVISKLNPSVIENKVNRTVGTASFTENR